MTRNKNPYFKIKKNQKKAHGLALIVTLFVLFFLMTLATTYVFTVQLEINLARNFEDNLKAKYIAKAGVYRAMADIRNNSISSGKFSYPRPNRTEDAETYNRYKEIYDKFQMGGGRYSVKFKDDFGYVGLGPMDESSKINLNLLAEKKDRDKLSDLFESKINDIMIVDKIIDCLIDYVDADDFANISGAEQAEYDDLDPPATIANAKMKNISEFLVILDVLKNLYPDEIDDSLWFGEDTNHNGQLDDNENDGHDSPPFDDMDDELDKGIMSYVTIDSGQADINPNTASIDVLKIMRPDNYEEIIENRIQGPVTGKSSVFRIRSYGTYHGYTHVVEWVVLVNGKKIPSVIRMYSL